MAAAWSAEDDAKLTELHANGTSLNESSRQMGRAKATVGRHARRLGLAWDQSATAVAVAARTVTNRDRRTRIIEKLYVQAEADIDSIASGQWQTILRAKGGVEKPKTLSFVPPRDRREAQDAIYKAMATAKNLESIDAGSGAAEVVGLLGDMATKLGLTVNRDQE